jgi:protein-disulfide isomerase
MIENSPLPVNKDQDRHRIRPQTSWRLPLLIGGLIVFFALGLTAGYFLWGSPLIAARAELSSVKSEFESLQASVKSAAEEASQSNPTQSPSDSEIKQVTRYPVPEDGDPSFGPADAPITIIEFSDFQCPYCQKWHAEVWQKLAAEYPSQIRLVYRDFPLYSIHPQAGPAANAAECANEQNKFWQYHDLLFSGTEELGEAAYLSYARQTGLDMTAFEQCLSENRFDAEITADFEYASGIGIQSTPTFFLNGIALIGAQPYEVFKEVIDLELAGKLSQ